MVRGGEPHDPLIGATIGARFQIAARMASSTSGSTYRAIDLTGGRGVTLRMLPAGASADPAVVARFRQEGAALTSLHDPHTLMAYELGEAPGGMLYVVMELLLGESLDDVLRRNGGPLPWRRVAAIARAVCDSLAEAHERGMMHGEIRPSNIYVQQRDGADIVKVIELGIARILNATHPSAGVFDPTYDLYGLGLLMYDLIAPGRAPNGATPAPLMQRAQIPPELDRVVNRCTARDPQARFRNAREVAAELDHALAAKDPARHTPRPDSEAETSLGIGPLRSKSPSSAPRGERAPQPAERVAQPAERTPRPKWGVAYEQLSMPDPNYTDHALPRLQPRAPAPGQPAHAPHAHAPHAPPAPHAAHAGHAQLTPHAAALQPPFAQPAPAKPRSNKVFLIVAILILWSIVATVFALVR